MNNFPAAAAATGPEKPVRPKFRGGFLSVIGVLAIMMYTNCGGKSWRPGQPLPKEKIKIGILYISDPRVEHSGYAHAHAQGIEEMRRNIGLAPEQILNSYNIQETDTPGIESAMRNFIAQGVNVIIASSWGYMNTCEKLAEEFPGVVFAHAGGYKYNETNFTNFFGRFYQARYLSGIVAGLKTRTGKIGFVSAMSKNYSGVSSGINAFALGVERVNSAARVYVKVTYSWFDPMGETSAARDLIAAGCDVLAQHCDTSQPQLEAEKAGLWGIGYNSDMSVEAPGAVITSVVWYWDVYYSSLVRNIIDGSFTTAPYFGGIADGIVNITPLVPGLAAEGTEKILEQERERINSGSFGIFYGQMRTNDGRIIGAEGQTLSDNEIRNGIDWYYHTVIEL
jgi:basic membrane protein A